MTTATILFLLSIVISVFASSGSTFLFRVDQFTDVTKKCKSDKKISYILNEDNPAEYISIDPGNTKHYKKKRREVHREEIFKKIATNEDYSKASQNIPTELDKDIINNANLIFRKIVKKYRKNKGLVKITPTLPYQSPYKNKTFDCSIQFETELPKGDKTSGRYDALSLIIVELDHNQIGMPADYQNLNLDGNNYGDSNGRTTLSRLFSIGGMPNSKVEVHTSGKNGKTYKNVTKRAQYSERIWPGHNPNFLLSGQLSGFDSIDYRTKIDPQVSLPKIIHT